MHGSQAFLPGSCVWTLALEGSHGCPLLLLPAVTEWLVHSQGHPHFVAFSVALAKWWPGRDRILGLPPERVRPGICCPPSIALGLPGERQGQETVVPAPAVPLGGAGGWWEGGGRIGFLSLSPPPSLERGWGGYLKMLSIDI